MVEFKRALMRNQKLLLPNALLRSRKVNWVLGATNEWLKTTSKTNDVLSVG